MSSDAQLAKAKLALLVKCAQLPQYFAQFSSPDDVAEAEMCVGELIERCKGKLANPTTSQESCTKRFEDSQEDGYDSDVTSIGHPSSQSSSPVSPMSPSFIPLQKRRRCE